MVYVCSRSFEREEEKRTAGRDAIVHPTGVSPGSVHVGPIALQATGLLAWLEPWKSRALLQLAGEPGALGSGSRGRVQASGCEGGGWREWRGYVF